MQYNIKFLIYLSWIYPNYKLHYIDLSIITNIFEAFTIIIGIHIFRNYSLAIISRQYIPISMRQPKWIKILFYIMEHLLLLWY